MANLTGKQIFGMAAAMVSENSATYADMLPFSIQYLNIILQECLEIENSIRRAAGETELTEAPWLATIDDEVTYHAQLTRTAFPYALLEHMYEEQMNYSMADKYRAKYEVALMRAEKMQFEDITDVYAPDYTEE